MSSPNHEVNRQEHRAELRYHNSQSVEHPKRTRQSCKHDFSASHCYFFPGTPPRLTQRSAHLNLIEAVSTERSSFKAPTDATPATVCAQSGDDEWLNLTLIPRSNSSPIVHAYPHSQSITRYLQMLSHATSARLTTILLKFFHTRFGYCADVARNLMRFHHLLSIVTTPKLQDSSC